MASAASAARAVGRQRCPGRPGVVRPGQPRAAARRRRHRLSSAAGAVPAHVLVRDGARTLWRHA